MEESKSFRQPAKSCLPSACQSARVSSHAHTLFEVRCKSRRGKISLAIRTDAFRLFLQGRNSGRGRNRLTEDVHLTFRLGRIAAAIRVVTEFGQLENASLDRSVKSNIKKYYKISKATSRSKYRKYVL